MANIYLAVLAAKKELVNGEIFNAGYDNFKVSDKWIRLTSWND